MGNPAGVKRYGDVLEEARLKATQLLRKGVSEAEVARQGGGAHSQSVNRSLVTLKESERRGLRKRGVRARSLD